MSVGRAKHLRANLTGPERKLWSALRRLRVDGFYFRRQVPFEDYVLDFASHRERLVIEVDGIQHYEPKRAERDRNRTQFIEGRGYIVLRYSNYAVLQNLDGVMRDILEKLTERRCRKFTEARDHIQRDVQRQPGDADPPTRSGIASLAGSTAPQRGRQSYSLGVGARPTEQTHRKSRAPKKTCGPSARRDFCSEVLVARI